jgi:hypothetical protein
MIRERGLAAGHDDDGDGTPFLMGGEWMYDFEAAKS